MNSYIKFGLRQSIKGVIPHWYKDAETQNSVADQAVNALKKENAKLEAEKKTAQEKLSKNGDIIKGVELEGNHASIKA